MSYTCTAGTLAIQNCPAPQIVTTEGTGQVITETVTNTGGRLMRQLKSSHVLPVPQVLLAAILIEWGFLARAPHGLNPWAVCVGINAQATLVGVLAVSFELDVVHVPWIPTLFSATRLIFLCGVALLWYLVGHTLDERRSRKSTEHETPVGRLIWDAFLVFLGTFLLTVVVYFPSTTDTGGIGDVVPRALFLAWSVVLIVFPGIHLVMSLRRRFAKPVHSSETGSP